MDEQWTVVFGSLTDGVYRIVTGFESEEEAHVGYSSPQMNDSRR